MALREPVTAKNPISAQDGSIHLKYTKEQTTMCMRHVALAAVVSFGLSLVVPVHAQEKSIVVSSTTSTQDSGLFAVDHANSIAFVDPVFEAFWQQRRLRPFRPGNEPFHPRPPADSTAES
jgi:hypothetical protein